MTWLSWRQQRTEALIAAGILALLAALLIPSGLDMASVYDHDRLVGLPRRAHRSCGVAIDSFTDAFPVARGLPLAWFTLVPGLIGVLLAAPFVSSSRTARTGLPGRRASRAAAGSRPSSARSSVAALIAAVVMTRAHHVVARAARPPARAEWRRASSTSKARSPLGYVLFALGLALAVGVVWRRTVPALIVGFIGYVVGAHLRRHLAAPALPVAARSGPGASSRQGAARRRTSTSRLGAEPVPERQARPHRSDLHARPAARAGQGGPSARSTSLPRQHGRGYTHAVYQPASRFWLFQGIETALFGGAAVALIAFAAWWTHRRAS